MSSLCTCTRLRRAARISAGLYDEALAPAGMTTTQFGLLRTLERTGPVSLSALAQAAVYDRTTLNRLLKPVETAGLVEPGEGTDGRARIVQLSAAGKAMLNRAVPLWQAAQKAVEARLGGDLAQLHKLLDRIEELRA